MEFGSPIALESPKLAKRTWALSVASRHRASMRPGDPVNGNDSKSTFGAPEFDWPEDEKAKPKKLHNARLLRLTLNGEVIHENVELTGPTPGGLTGQESRVGPLMPQGSRGPVAFRNFDGKFVRDQP